MMPVNIELFLLLNFVLVNYSKYAFLIIKFGCHKSCTLFVSIVFCDYHLPHYLFLVYYYVIFLLHGNPPTTH
jgi:hypothetical protein